MEQLTKLIQLPDVASSNVVASHIEQEIMIGDKKWSVMIHYSENGDDFEWAIHDLTDEHTEGRVKIKDEDDFINHTKLTWGQYQHIVDNGLNLV